ncbi:tRNA 4-thiouridine(8) synthase ThiI [Caldibacillus lycopersici]|uniref:Probable tRNA sulfurtransferase n=1 Tax=Perspicuibacillus lycopersici TaxID=1325689 RepID=A0AAE3LTM0_9BACI|nr:tRNA uracil 4-sulfurtransferase ThiI [Perspicuibacillus lycopersici]MCU9614218.1 tRNA 4-thiouridine(8) synthase ThiI [Perspicuibacillus lycopersici]
MIYDQILIRYGEISTKGKNRTFFVDKLRRNLKYVLNEYKNIKIRADRDRMYIQLNGEEWENIAGKLQKVFGIQSFSPVVKVSKDIEQVKEQALIIFQKLQASGKTFKVSTKRSDKEYPYDTNELNYLLGSHLLQNIDSLTVDVHHPDLELKVEVRKDAIYLTCEVIKGAGGMPVGSSGKAMLMLSGGIDSPVAGYLSMKRGLKLEAVHFYSPPFTSERSKQKVLDLGKKLAQVSGQFIIHIVPFTEIQQLIQEHVPENYTMTITRRMMLRITEEIRHRQEALAIVTGESLGQVASQTLESMFTINEVTNTPIIRPLVTMDKNDIIDVAREIDTLEISNRPYEDCCTVFTPAQPKTKPKRENAHKYEGYMDFEALIKKAVEGVETIIVNAGDSLEQSEFSDLF